VISPRRALGLSLALLTSACGSTPSAGSLETTSTESASPREAPRVDEGAPSEPAQPAEAAPSDEAEAIPVAGAAPQPADTWDPEDRAADEAPTPPADDVLVAIDTHSDTTQRLLDEHADLASRLPDGHLDLPRMRDGGLTAVFMSIWVDPRRFRGEAAWDRAQALVASVRAFVAAHPDEVVLATTAAEVRAAARDHRVAFLMGIEGAHGLGESEPTVLLDRLGELAQSGVRYVTITWTNDNVFGHASTGAHPGRGLTDAGRALVSRMNELGVMVDVSHVSDRTALDAIEASRAPVFASHSGARAVGDHPRNLPDTILRRIGETHGAVCINYYAQFVDPAYGEARRAVEREHRAEFEALPRGRSWSTSAARNALARRLAPELHPPTLRTLGEHFAHVSRVAGADVPCLGSDFDGIGELPRGMDDVSDLPALFRELERRHLEVRTIAGDNVLRVMQSAEAAARHD
jgi:membrane dipeptidase